MPAGMAQKAPGMPRAVMGVTATLNAMSAPNRRSLANARSKAL